MDLNDAIALLDEIYTNADASPRLTPKTPRTPLTPHPRNKRARSKSSDNSSNYSGERLNERFLENVRSQDKERKRPFLKKIGISMTDDKPLLTKLAPKIMGKPYLEKIGPSRAIDRSYLENIGSSRTLDKFVFDAPKANNEQQDLYASDKGTGTEEARGRAAVDRRNEIRGFTAGERRRSGKNFLLKMYSFETEDLEESSLSVKVPHRDPLRGASLNDVVDSGTEDGPHPDGSEIETPSASAAELVKCRVTTSEEIISSSRCLGNSSMDIIHWENSPRTTGRGTENRDAALNNASVPSSPIRGFAPLATATDAYGELDRVRSSRQISEDILDKRKIRHEQFENRGASSDNLAKERITTPVFAEIKDRLRSPEPSGKGSRVSSVRQLQGRLESQEIFTESYAEFKRRTQTNFHTSNALKRLVAREKSASPSTRYSANESELPPKCRSKSVENSGRGSLSENQTEPQARRTRARSVLRKQQGIDHSTYPNERNALMLEPDSQQRKGILHEPSQETLDLLSELQKIKSLLRTPSIDRLCESSNAVHSPLKPLPKRVLLTDKEFSLSIERENSVRRPSRINARETKCRDPREKVTESPEKSAETRTPGPALFEKRCLSLDYADDEKPMMQKTEPRALSLISATSPHSKDILESTGIALLSRDSKSSSSGVFIEASERPSRGISVEAEVKKIESEIRSSKHEGVLEAAKLSQATQIGRSVEKSREKSGSASALPRTTGKIEMAEVGEDKTAIVKDNAEQLAKLANYHSEVNCPDRELQVSPKKKSQPISNAVSNAVSNANDAFETNSPKATPFRIKKRLGRISIEKSVKQESFAPDKVDCKEVAVQKRAKCLPL
jgi:hypothetical protein